MKKVFFILSALFAAAGISAQVTVDVRIDSMALLVGEQAKIKLDVIAPATKAVTFPDLRPGSILTGDVEVVELTPIDTVPLNDGKTLQLSRSYTITSFCDHDTLYQLPPFEIKVGDDVELSKSLALKIFTIDVDTLHVDEFFPPKEYEKVPITWDDVKGAIYMSCVVLLLLALAFFLFYRYRTGQPILNLNLRREKKLPPHQVALAEINRIKSERKWADEDSKEYYTLLTEALRRYMSERYSFNAMEMTSSDIIEHLHKHDDVMLEELRQLFGTADLVKFAKASTLIGENDLNLVNAITYIQQTKVEEDPNAKPEPEPVSKEQQQYTTQRRMMIAGMVACGIAAAVLLGLIGYRLWDLFA